MLSENINIDILPDLRLTENKVTSKTRNIPRRGVKKPSLLTSCKSRVSGNASGEFCIAPQTTFKVHSAEKGMQTENKKPLHAYIKTFVFKKGGRDVNEQTVTMNSAQDSRPYRVLIF